MRSRETLRRAAECALLGVLWTACSLPLVTAGAAWSAVAEICDAWIRGYEPPMLRTFASVIRRDFLGGIGMSAVGLLATAPLVEARISMAARIPGVRVEASALGLIGIAAVCVAAQAFPLRAAALARAPAERGQAGWRESLRAAATLSLRKPWVIPLTAVALGLPAFLVVVYPALIVFIGGPAGYAVSAVCARATASASTAAAVFPRGDI